MSDDIIVALQDENAALRATVARLERVIKEYAHHRSKCNSLYHHLDGVIYDVSGWVCSVCGGWNHLRDEACTHTHRVTSPASEGQK